MKRKFISGFSTLAVLCAFSAPALADISAEEVRDALISYYEAFGSSVEVGSEDNSAAGITLTGFAVSTPLPKGRGLMTFVFSSIGLRNTGDGAVAIELPASMQNKITLEPEGKPTISVALKTSLPGYSGLVSGSLDDMKIQSNGDGVTLMMNSLSVGGAEIPMSIILQEGPYSIDYNLKKTADDRRDISGSASVQSLEILADIKEPGGPGFFNLKMDVRDLANIFAVNLPNSADPLAILAAGIDVSADLTSGAVALDASFQDKGKNFAFKTSSTEQRLAFALSPDAISYDLSGAGVTVHLTSSDLPVPAVDLAYDSAEMSFAVPLSHAAQPRDYHAKVALRGLTVAEALWGIVDPGQSLPRDPATVAVDVSGKVMVLTDLMNPEALASIANSGVPPMLPVSLVLNELTASFAGAALNGTGSFEFNFQNPKTIDGVPLPVGEANLSLDGGYGLLDKLAAMGLVPENAATGVRAMLGVFAKPVGDDRFESKIEITEEGAITANGQRIK